MSDSLPFRAKRIPVIVTPPGVKEVAGRWVDFDSRRSAIAMRTWLDGNPHEPQKTLAIAFLRMAKLTRLPEGLFAHIATQSERGVPEEEAKSPESRMLPPPQCQARLQA